MKPCIAFQQLAALHIYKEKRTKFKKILARVRAVSAAMCMLKIEKQKKMSAR